MSFSKKWTPPSPPPDVFIVLLLLSTPSGHSAAHPCPDWSVSAAHSAARHPWTKRRRRIGLGEASRGREKSERGTLCALSLKSKYFPDSRGQDWRARERRNPSTARRSHKNLRPKVVGVATFLRG